MLIAAYVVSALLEVVGIALVVVDVLADRARRVELTKERQTVYGGSRRRLSSDTALLFRREISERRRRSSRPGSSRTSDGWSPSKRTPSEPTRSCRAC